jgi:sulfur oxidation c-type cytochrome SoxA
MFFSELKLDYYRYLPVLRRLLLLLLIKVNIVLILNCSSTKIRRYEDPAKAEIARSEELKALERGKEIWFNPNTGTNGRSCESCHPDGEMTNAEQYPRYKQILRTMATLSMTHNFAVVNESKGKAWEVGSYDANALVLYVKFLANGKPIHMAWPKKYRDDWISQGKIAFNNPDIGTNNLSCASCHQNNGKKQQVVHREPAPKLTGIAATYPRYSFEQEKVITLEQQVNYCIEKKLSGTPLPLDNETIVAICCYVTSLSKGKKIAVANYK